MLEELRHIALELLQLKINAMTPLDALNYLDQLIKKVQSSGN